MGKCVIVAGNISDGFTIYGPFDDGEVAIAWAESKIEKEWWVATLHGACEFCGPLDDPNCFVECSCACHD